MVFLSLAKISSIHKGNISISVYPLNTAKENIWREKSLEDTTVLLYL